MKDKTLSILRKLKWWQATLLFFVASFAYFGSLFFSRASFSASDVNVFISGPDTFKAQEGVEFELKIKNRSKFNLTGALYVTLPEFLSFPGADGNEQRIEIDRITGKGEVAKKIAVFAKETQKQGDIKVRAEYTPEGLNGRFEGFVGMNVKVSSLPITVIFDLPEKAVDGQLLRGSFHFVAEKELEVLPLLVRLILPEDFSLKDAEPKPKETTTWEFANVNPQESHRVDFEGIVKGYESASKNFDLLFGIIEGDAGFSEQYKVSREVKISSAPIDFKQTINGISNYIASPGEELKFNIDYKNQSGVDIEDATITAELTGEAFDLKSLNTGLGYLNENTKTIIWNKEFAEQLAVLGKDESGSVEFSISLKKNISAKDYRDKSISVKSKAVINSPKPPLALRGLSVRAEHLSEVKIRTNLELFTEAYYYEGPFSNLGPIPPRFGEKTSYSIVWKAHNTLNEVKDATVEASLPQNVSFEQKIYPASANLIYNSQAHSISWNIGALKPGVGSVFPAETVTFGIALIPTEEMRGFPAELIQQAKLSGTDTFTNELIEYEAQPLNTILPGDEGMREGDGVVQ